ncbi:MAG: acyl carrier protein [Archangium sp.]|nr:acyl carrier protein [Archangium sp.]MDP3157072.1 acyl carrier protein [Archangium sp.]MDP3575789.1 acyl carrier protein [Archangium sp.]
METREQVRQFIISNFYVSDPAALADHASLLDAGVVDSTGVLEIITFIESTFSVSVEDQEMLPENLDAVSNIVKFVHKKTGK